MDASGSMWGQIDGRNKIVIAREVLAGLIKELPDDLNVGLVAYGHRSKGDCKDVETLVPVGPLNKDKLIKTIDAINPKGMTPITHSIQLTAELTRKIKGSTTIVLVSDGEETCDGDPCKLTRTLVESGARFVMHVVGFGVGDKVTSQLQCIARAGGGEYYTASSAAKLKEALGAIIKKSLAENLVVTARTDKGKQVQVKVSVMQAGSDKAVAEHEGNRLGFLLPAGNYDLLVKCPGYEDQKAAGLALVQDKVLEKQFIFKQSSLRVTVKDHTGAPLKAHVRAFREDGTLENEAPTKKGVATLETPAGAYKVEVLNEATNEYKTINDVLIEPGAEKSLEVGFTQGGLTVTVKNDQGQMLDAHVWVEKEDGWIFDGETGKKTVVFDLPEGTYKVTANYSETGEEKSVEGLVMAPGEEKKVELVFAKAGLNVTVKNDQGEMLDAHVWIVPEDGTVSDAQTEKGRVSFNTPPGKYRVEARYEATGEYKVVENVLMKPGEAKEVEIVFGVKSGLTVTVKDGQGRMLDAHVWVSPEEGNVFDQQTEGQPVSFDIPAGTYKIEARYEDTSEMKVLEGVVVQPGEAKEVEIVYGVKSGLTVTVKDGQGRILDAHVWVSPEEGNVFDQQTEGQAVSFDIPAGTYKIEARYEDTSEMKVLEGVVVQPGEAKAVEIVFAQKSGLTVDVKTDKGQPAEAVIWLTGDNNMSYSEQNEKKPVTFDVTPGNYLVEVKYDDTGEMKTFEGVPVAAGEAKKLDVSFTRAVLTVVVKNSDNLPAQANVWVNWNEGNLSDSGSTEKQPLSFVVPAGSFNVEVLYEATEETKTVENVTLASGEEKTVEVIFE